MSVIELRPHHALCTLFYVGEGYSDSFNENMSRITHILRSSSPMIKLTSVSDAVCKECPHSQGSCGEKAAAYDNAVLEICGLEQGSVLPWAELSSLVRERIITCGKLSQVCGDCQWFMICGKETI